MHHLDRLDGLVTIFCFRLRLDICAFFFSFSTCSGSGSNTVASTMEMNTSESGPEGRELEARGERAGAPKAGRAGEDEGILGGRGALDIQDSINESGFYPTPSPGSTIDSALPGLGCHLRLRKETRLWTHLRR